MGFYEMPSFERDAQGRIQTELALMRPLRRSRLLDQRAGDSWRT